MLNWCGDNKTSSKPQKSSKMPIAESINTMIQ